MGTKTGGLTNCGGPVCSSVSLSLSLSLSLSVCVCVCVRAGLNACVLQVYTCVHIYTCFQQYPCFHFDKPFKTYLINDEILKTEEPNSSL